MRDRIALMWSGARWLIGNTSGHRRSAERQHVPYSVLLQRLRWRDDWRTKLYLYPATLSDSYAICHSESNSYIHANAYIYGHSNCHAHSDSHVYPDSDCNGHSNCHVYPDCNGNGNSHSHCHVYPDTNAYRKCSTFSNTNGYCYRDCDSYSYCNPDTYTAAYSVTKGYSPAKASAHSAAAPALAALANLNNRRHTMNRRRLVALGVAAALGFSRANLASAGIVNINPSKDNTLYEYDPVEGDHSNALGFHFFAGENRDEELRRGVLAFDIAGMIPPGSTITAVSLSINMSRTPTERCYLWSCTSCLPIGARERPLRLEEKATERQLRLMMPHGDTVSSIRFLDTQGGDFSATVSASQTVGVVGHYTWSSAQMVADVQSWLDNPASNFGWLVLGDETDIATAKRFDTRESASPPVLTIEFTPAPRVAPSPRPRPTPAPRP